MKRYFKCFIILCNLSVPFFAEAHEGHHKEHHPPVTKEEKNSLAQINEMYLAQVKPIFQNKCFDCHSSKTQFPWYSKVPGIKQFIQHDIDEAHEHIDMEQNFPFKSHAEPLEDLAAIDKTVTKNEMPPWRYRIMHSGSDLTSAEKEIVHQWVQFGKDLLKNGSK